MKITAVNYFLFVYSTSDYIRIGRRVNILVEFEGENNSSRID